MSDQDDYKFEYEKINKLDTSVKKKKMTDYVDKYIILKQSTYRILVKSLLYRFLGVLITLIWSLVLTGDLTLALKFSIMVEFTQTIVYFIYEHCWNNIKWGYIKKTKYQTDPKTQVIGTRIKEIDTKSKKSALKKIEGPGIDNKQEQKEKVKIIYDPSNIIF